MEVELTCPTCGSQVRKTLSFSKNQDNHEGAIWNFIHHYWTDTAKMRH